MDELLCVRSIDVFAIYPKILNDLLETDKEKLRRGIIGKVIQLPSDFEWKQKVYFRLLEKQRIINAAIDRGEVEVIKQLKLQWDPRFAFENISSKSIRCRQKCLSDNPIMFLSNEDLNLWNLEDISKAGKLLNKPPLPCDFIDEQEMRRVYSLIYDVFRYKIVLNQSLNDVSFFTYFPQLSTDSTRVWLLLFDLNLRHFLKRDPEETIRKNILFQEANLIYIETCLWKHHVKLAASISRLRIRNKALQLSALLPIHLQDEKVAIAAANPIISGWINSFKKRTNKLAKINLEEIGFSETEEYGEEELPLELNHYKLDKLCPQFLTCIPSDRSLFAQSKIIKNHAFIMQDRTFALGPAIFYRLLDYFELDGNVIQTHVASPKSTAYLASLFLSNDRVEKFIAFGAGVRLKEYNEYMELLNVNNVTIYSENFCDLSINSLYFDKVVGVFATPPNSYSGVQDPIDLICSRGGDLSMLEVMTESEISNEAKNRVAEVLREQKETLRLSMSRPQVQFILYETHSIINSENEDMVACAINTVNEAARAKHVAAEKEKLRLEALAAAEAYPIPFQVPATVTPRKKGNQEELLVKKSSPREDKDEKGLEFDEFGNPLKSDAELEDEYSYVEVPPTDTFEVEDIPDTCLNQDKCLDIKNQGCFFSLIKRKEVTCLDAKYMIKIAEARGVFGHTGTKKSKIKTAKKSEKKDDVIEERASSRRLKRKRSDMQVVIDRLSQPTQSFLTRSNLQRRSSAENKILNPIRCLCLRHQSHHQEESMEMAYEIPILRAKQWWMETAKYMQSLKELSGREKLNFSQIFIEVQSANIPPLILPREDKKSDGRSKSQPSFRKPYPLSISDLEFHDYRKAPRYFLCPLKDDNDTVNIRSSNRKYGRSLKQKLWSSHSFS